MNKSKSNIMIYVITLVLIIAVLFIEPVKQNLSYHLFVDNDEFMGIENFWNVMSNLPFLLVGLFGIIKLKSLQVIREMTMAYWVFFFAVAMVSFGSGYYHLYPDNHTLVWDRLPMTVAFMSLFAIIVSEFFDEHKGLLLLIPLLIIGVSSVFYWQWTESNGIGDLRFYALVQFLPIILIPLILLMYKPKFTHKSGYWWLLLAYVIAKFLEYFDAEVYHMFAGLISGHSLKHVAVAIGVLALLNSYNNRSRFK